MREWTSPVVGCPTTGLNTAVNVLQMSLNEIEVGGGITRILGRGDAVRQVAQ